MINRFFKLLYGLGLIAIAAALPITILYIFFDDVVITSYKARCISNGEYVVLQGAPPTEYWVLTDIVLEDTIYGDERKDLNFYCKYYDAIQPYLAEYFEAETNSEIVQANQRFFNFKQSLLPNVFTYPELYTLEVVDEEIQWHLIYGPLISWFGGSVIFFLFLQFLRICYTYIAFGELVWHPFKARK